MNQAQRKPEEATTKVIRLNHSKRITHFGRCFPSVDLKHRLLLVRAPNFRPLFTSSLDAIFIKRHNFLFVVDAITFNDYVLVFSTPDICTNALDAIKRRKAMGETNEMMEEFFFKHNFYIPIFNEVKSGVAGAYEMKADILELVVSLSPQKCQEYMNLAFEILCSSHVAPPVHHYQYNHVQVHNDLSFQMGYPTLNSNAFDITVFSASHLSDTSSLVDGMNPEAVPGSSTGHSAHKRSSQNVNCDEYQAIPTAHQHQALQDQARNYPTENSNSSDITVFSDSRLSDTVALVDGMNSEAVPEISGEQSSRKRSSQNVSCEESQVIPSSHQHQALQDQARNNPTENSNSSDITVFSDSRLSDTVALVDGMNSEAVPEISGELSSHKRSSQNVSCDEYQAIPSAHQHQALHDQASNNPVENSRLSDIAVIYASLVESMNSESTDEHSSRKRKLLVSNVEMEASSGGDKEVNPSRRNISDIYSSLVESMNSEAVPAISVEQSSRKRKLQIISNVKMEASFDDDEEVNPSRSNHVVQDIIKSPGYKLYEREFGGKMRQRLFVSDPTNELLGFEYAYNSKSKTFFCNRCQWKFGITVGAKLINDENGEYVRLGINKHQCEQKEFQKVHQAANSLIVADESRIVKLPHYKLYQKQWGGNMSKRLVIYDSSNLSLGYEFGFRHAQNDYYCWECKNKFSTLVCAKLVEDETGNYIQMGIRDHKCNLKILEYIIDNFFFCCIRLF